MRNHFHLCVFVQQHFENFVINQEQNLFSRNHLLYFHYVIKELVHTFSCAYSELWMHLGSLESTQEAIVATLTLLSCSPNFPRASIIRYTHAKHEPILEHFPKILIVFLLMVSSKRSCALSAQNIFKS